MKTRTRVERIRISAHRLLAGMLFVTAFPVDSPADCKNGADQAISRDILTALGTGTEELFYHTSDADTAAERDEFRFSTYQRAKYRARHEAVDRIEYSRSELDYQCQAQGGYAHYTVYWFGDEGIHCDVVSSSVKDEAQEPLDSGNYLITAVVTESCTATLVCCMPYS